MTAIRDPYPESLVDDEIDYQHATALGVPGESIDAGTRELIRALNRIAQALEAGHQPVQNAPQRPVAPLTALPPVQTVANTPACTFHGTEKVRPSTNGKGGFYCSAMARPGEPANPKGYCTWHS